MTMDIDEFNAVAAKCGMGLGYTSAGRPGAYHQVAPGLTAVVEMRGDGLYVPFVSVDIPQEYMYLAPHDGLRCSQTDSFSVARASAIIGVVEYIMSCRQVIEALLESIEDERQ